MDKIVFRQSKTDNFIISFCDEDLGIIDNIISVLENSLITITDFFECPLTDKIRIIVYPNRQVYKQALNIVDYEDWMVGNCTEHLISVVSPQNAMPTHSYEDMIQVLIHEIVHEICDIKIPVDNAPFWLAEGIACYLANQYNNLENFELVLAKNSFPTVLEISGDSSAAIGGYTYSPIYVKYFLEKFGKVAFLDCLGNDKLLSSFIDDNFERRAIESFVGADKNRH